MESKVLCNQVEKGNKNSPISSSLKSHQFRTKTFHRRPFRCSISLLTMHDSLDILQIDSIKCQASCIEMLIFPSEAL